ncbi:MAG: Uncharacterised protein [Prochlorococcus marinus str. MIT 9215]|nr:MAG: Uncharacterised protein [Prochlorococcus marinus str. MIT 9215]
MLLDLQPLGLGGPLVIVLLLIAVAIRFGFRIDPSLAQPVHAGWLLVGYQERACSDALLVADSQAHKVGCGPSTEPQRPARPGVHPAQRLILVRTPADSGGSR